MLKISTFFAVFFFSFIVFYTHLPLIFSANKTCIFIHPSETFHEFINDVKHDYKAKHFSIFLVKVYAYLKRIDRHMEPGEYCFVRHDSVSSILHKIKQGNKEHHRFTIVDGWAYQDLAHHLSITPSIYHPELLNNNIKIITSLKIVENNLEGQFFPETYDYAYPDTPIDILQRAHVLMQKKITAFFSEPQINNRFKNPYELLIVASIIQKESSYPEDQKLVASVIVNRLKLNMKLQMDPTVIYGLGENRHLKLDKHDLKIDSLYNTYLYKGLPPTPICMPGETALFAAAHPKESSYLYFVSKKNGTHQFSETLTEQTLAIKQYLLHTSTEENHE